VHDVTLLAYIAVVLVITMWPSPRDPGRIPLLRRVLDWAHDVGLPAAFDLATLEVTANVAMFVPLGLLLASSRRLRRPWLAAPLGLAFSAAIETVQILLPGRYPTVQDVAANTAGAALGAALVVAHRVWRARRTG
jgi:VanZ family protein